MRTSRRSFTRGALGVAGLGALGACDDAPDPSPHPASAAPTSAPTRRERPAQVAGIGALLDVGALHDTLKEFHDTGLVSARTWPSTAIALLGLPLAFAQHVDEQAVPRFAVLEDGAFVVGVPLRNADLALATATAGPTAQWARASVGPLEVLTRLDGTRVGACEGLAVCRNALVATTDRGVFMRAVEAAVYVATPDAEGYAALEERRTPARVAAVIRGSALRSLALRNVEAMPQRLRPLAEPLWKVAFGSYDASDLPIVFTADASRASLDVTLPDVAPQLGLAPVPASVLRGHAAADLVAIVGDAAGGPVDASLLGALDPSLADERIAALLAACKRKPGGPLTLGAGRGASGRSFVLRATLEDGATLIAALDAIAEGDAKKPQEDDAKKPKEDDAKAPKEDDAKAPPPALTVEKLILTRIGDVHRVKVGGLILAVHVRGGALLVVVADEPLAELARTFEEAPAVEATLPRALIGTLPDPLRLGVVVDLLAFAPSRGGRPGARALAASLAEDDGRAVLRVAISPAAWRALGDPPP